MTPQISIIIINYNTFEMTSQCIESVYEKTKNVEFEIVLVDNASTECNADLFAERFPSVILVKSKENIGFAKGNNLGIKTAKSDVILLLNSDTILVNNAVSICYDRLVKDKNIGLITSKLIYPNGNIQHQCRRFETISLLLTEQLRLHKLWTKEKRAKILLNGYFNHQTEIETDRIWGTFFMLKREILNALPEKKLADTFFMYGEDNEWCYQIRRLTPFKILYFPDAVVIHKMGGSNFGEQKTSMIHYNKRIYMRKYYGTLKTKIYFFLHDNFIKKHVITNKMNTI